MADRIEPASPGAAKPHAPPPPYFSQSPAHSVVNIPPSRPATAATATRTTTITGPPKKKSTGTARSIWNLIAHPPTPSSSSRKVALADAYLRLFCVSILLSITAVVYAVSVQLSDMRPSFPRQADIHANDDNGFGSGSGNGPNSGGGVSPLLHCMFAALLFVLAMVFLRCFRLVVRVHVYHPKQVRQDAVSSSPALRRLSLAARYSLPPSPLRNDIESAGNDDHLSSDNSNSASSSSFRNNRLFLSLFGPPPPKPAAPRLPSYNSALRSAARLSAIRYEEASNIYRSNGDRDRVVGATGDSEDIEIERVRRMGGGPPAYQTPEMYASTVVLAAPRSSRLSSATSTTSHTPHSNSSNRRSRITEFRLSSWLPSSFLRRLSWTSFSFTSNSNQNNNNRSANENHLKNEDEKEEEKDTLPPMRRHNSRHSYHVSSDRVSRPNFKRRSVGGDEKRFSLPL